MPKHAMGALSPGGQFTVLFFVFCFYISPPFASAPAPREALVQKASCFPCHCEEAQPTRQSAFHISLVVQTLLDTLPFLHPRNRPTNTLPRIPRASPPPFNMAGWFIPPAPYRQTSSNSPQAHWRPDPQSRTAWRSATAASCPHAQSSPQRSPSGTPAQKTPRFRSPA